MVGQLFTVYDKKAECYGSPVFAAGFPTYRRNMKSMLADNPRGLIKVMYEYPDDFAIYQMGTLDDTVGILDVNTPPKWMEEVRSLVEEVNVERRERERMEAGSTKMLEKE